MKSYLFASDHSPIIQKVKLCHDSAKLVREVACHFDYLAIAFGAQIVRNAYWASSLIRLGLQLYQGQQPSYIRYASALKAALILAGKGELCQHISCLVRIAKLWKARSSDERLHRSLLLLRVLIRYTPYDQPRLFNIATALKCMEYRSRYIYRISTNTKRR